ncbi:MAG: alpha/beta fold hydrolase, partial [Planctomycetota bacterium]
MSARRCAVWLTLFAIYLFGVFSTQIGLFGGRADMGPPSSLLIERGLAVELPPMSDDGPVPGVPLAQQYRGWEASADRMPDRPPVILLHGSPGSFANFAGTPSRPGLGELTADGRRSYALDLPGMGSSRQNPPTWSARSHAHAVLAFVDEVGAEQAHIVGWSNGGAVALNMADIAEDRIASTVLLGSVGAQSTEGSGAYWFEQAKYEVGIAATHAAELLIPHFDLLDLSGLRGGLRNFDDTDQRPLAGIMRNLDIPTLILHGRDDFLVADWAAEHHHELMPRSTLIMTEHDHFMPFLAAEETAGHINRFIERHDDPNANAERETIDLAPRVRPFGEAGDAVLGWLHFAPALVVLPLVTIVGWVLPGRAWVAVLVGATELDIGVAWLGLAIGKGIRTVRNGNAGRPSKWLAVVFEPLAQLGLGFVFVQLIARPAIRLGPDWLHGVGWLVAVLALAMLFVVLPKLWTARGRQKLRASATRLMHHEWWPAWVLYAPLLPVFAWLSIKHRHPLAFTACNPGMPNGGGLAGESKADITRALVETGDDRVLYGEACETGASAEERAHALAERIESEPRLGGWPVMLKPDAGEQGRGVTRCSSQEDAARFFDASPGRSMVQRFHPGPHEVGVF